jgi:soluble lytic murein transglycosylase-like protein
MRNLVSWVIERCRKSDMLFRPLRDRPLAIKSALAALLLFLLVPTHPLRGENGHWLERVDRVEGRKLNTIIGIYSVLKSQRKDLNEDTAWAIARAIHQESERHSFDPMLILAVITVESRFQNAAVSAIGARGLMQIRPAVAQALAEETNLGGWEGIESLADPVTNIKIGALYLSQLKKRFKNLKLALAAYNWGPTKIHSRLKAKKPISWRYTTKVLSVYDRYRRQYEAS